MAYNVSIYNPSNLRTSNLASAGKFFHGGRTFRATMHVGLSAQPRKQDFFRATAQAGLSTQLRKDFGSPPNSPLGLRETPCTTPSGLPSPISAHTASLLPCKGGYPQLHGRGYHSFPGSSGDISISHLGVSHGHRSVPHPSHCTSKATPDSSGLCRPPSRTLCHYNGSFQQESESSDNQTIQRTPSFLRESVHFEQ